MTVKTTKAIKVPKRPKEIVLGHLFEDADLYQLIYGQEELLRSIDAFGTSLILDQIMASCHESSKKKLSVLELMSGHYSRHLPLLRQAFPFLGEYYTNDVVKAPRKQKGVAGCVVGDIASPKFGQDFARVVGKRVDVVAALYHSSGNMMNPADGWRPLNRREMITVFRNVRDALVRDNGAFILDLCPGGPISGLEELVGPKSKEGVQECSLYVPDRHPILKRFGLPDYNVGAQIHYRSYPFFDRVRSHSADVLTKIKLVVGADHEDDADSVIATWEITNPFTQRLWGESELCEIAEDAGFDPDLIQFQSEEWGSNASEGQYTFEFEPLQRFQEARPDLPKPENLMARKMVFMT